MRVAWILMASLIWLHTAIAIADETPEIVEVEKSKKLYFSAVEKAGDGSVQVVRRRAEGFQME